MNIGDMTRDLKKLFEAQPKFEPALPGEVAKRPNEHIKKMEYRGVTYYQEDGGAADYVYDPAIDPSDTRSHGWYSINGLYFDWVLGGRKGPCPSGAIRWVLSHYDIQKLKAEAHITEAGVMPDAEDENLIGKVGRTGITLKNQGVSTENAIEEAAPRFEPALPDEAAARPREVHSSRSATVEHGDNFGEYLRTHEMDNELIIGGADSDYGFVWYPDQCGFTEEGKAKFAPILNAPYNVLQNGNIEVLCDDEQLGRIFLAASAGYVSDTTYKKWFTENAGPVAEANKPKFRPALPKEVEERPGDKYVYIDGYWDEGEPKFSGYKCGVGIVPDDDEEDDQDIFYYFDSMEDLKLHMTHQPGTEFTVTSYSFEQP